MVGYGTNESLTLLLLVQKIKLYFNQIMSLPLVWMQIIEHP